jgi:hypothetical protein
MSDSELFVAERPRNPFNSGQEVATRPVATLGALASAEQQRALGELQAQIMLARMNPRDPQAAVDAILRDCSRVTLAQRAQYEYARGGNDIKGPSVKLLEAIARRWGNVHSGFKIVHTEGNTSDVLTYAWDVETGYRDERQFQVRHLRDVRNRETRRMEQIPVVDERDIYELIANSAQRRKRSCLQAVIPADVIDAAVEQCEETLSANVDTSVEGLKKMLRAFAEFEVTQGQIEQRIQCKIEAISPGQMMQLSRIYTSLQDGISQPSQWFRAVDPPARPTRQTRQSSATQEPAKPAGEQALDARTNAAKDVIEAERAKPTTQVSPGPETSQEQPTDKVSGAEEDLTDTGAEFDHVVMGVNGEPVDGVVHMDPLAWAQQFLEVWNTVADHATLLFHNADALQDAKAVSPEADALLDGIELPETIGEAEPEVDEEERASAEILQHLPTLTTPGEVIAYSNSPAVSGPIQRWKDTGRDGLVTSVSAAFKARLANLRGSRA